MTRLEGGDPEREKATLLVVDDEKGPRESLRMILSPQHRVLVAEDGAQALALLAEHSVDAITVDLNMPGMKGDVLVRRVRKQHPQVEVIVITGYSSVETAVDGLRHGIFDYLTKPFDVVHVSNTVRRALSRRDSRHRMVDFLRGIGDVLGENQTSASAVETLGRSPHLQARLRAAVAHSAGGDATDEDAGRAPADEMLESVSAAIESHEPERAGHVRRVAFLAGLIAQRMGLAAERREEIRVASFLHDVGRVALSPGETPGDGDPSVDPHIAQETHAAVGADLARSLGYPQNVADAILHHHDRWDGRGRAGGLERDEIPLTARIIAVADAFDALTRDDPSRDCSTPAKAIAALRAQAGHQLDPDVLKELIAIAESGASSSGPLLGLYFEEGTDPADTIASATAWLETDR